jgi:hypothetical protein
VAKKVTYKFAADLTLNAEQGGGWLAVVSVVDENDIAQAMFTTAWKNASAGKRYIKAMVQKLTPRKSVKLIAGEALDAKGKPTSFAGELSFKA